jgi:hypothetical protein
MRRCAPIASRSEIHIRKVSAIVTAITRCVCETVTPPASVRPWLADAEAPMMKSFMPAQVAYPEISSSMADAIAIRALRPNR